LNLVCLLAFKLPVCVVDEDQDTGATDIMRIMSAKETLSHTLCTLEAENEGASWYVTYMWPSSTKRSVLGSFMMVLQRWSMRKVMLEGLPSLSVAGISRE